MAPTVSRELHIKARVVGAAFAVLGLAVIFGAGRDVFTSQWMSLLHSAGVGAATVAAGVILLGLVAYDLRRVRWALPIVQLGSVIALISILPLLGLAILGVRSSADQMGPAFLTVALTASLCIFVMVLSGQTRMDARRSGVD